MIAVAVTFECDFCGSQQRGKDASGPQAAFCHDAVVELPTGWAYLMMPKQQPHRMVCAVCVGYIGRRDKKGRDE